jgi:hypothetical protein
VALVDDGDVQAHLPKDKLVVEEIPDDRDRVYLDAERIVRGYLAGVVESTVLATWLTPETTPQIIRAITSRFAAAEIYRLRFGEQSFDDPEYAQVKYDEAMGMLNDIIKGNLLIDGVAQTEFDDSYFWPNNTTDPPKFTMADQY